MNRIQIYNFKGYFNPYYYRNKPLVQNDTVNGFGVRFAYFHKIKTFEENYSKAYFYSKILGGLSLCFH